MHGILEQQAELKPFYLIDLEFSNIDKVYADTEYLLGPKFEDLLKVKLIIKVRAPCQAMKFY